MTDLVVGLLACCTKTPYIEQIKACEDTWCSSSIIPIFYFSGEKCGNNCNSIGSNRTIHLEGVSDDVLSATYKQWYGLRWMYEKAPSARFYYFAGTDTYAKLDKIVDYLKDLNSEENLYIGGHGFIRNETGTEVYYHSGGSGFILSNSLMKEIYDLIPDWITVWDKNVNWIKVACDWSLAHLFASRKIPIKTIVNNHFRGCDWKGNIKGGSRCEFKCAPFPNENSDQEIWVCHYMEPDMMRNFHSVKDEPKKFHSAGPSLKESPIKEMEIVEANYRQKCSTPSDIYEHLPTIASYAEKCNIVTEFGMRSVISTWAMLYGLTRNLTEGKKLISADLNYSPNIEPVKSLCESLGIDFYFIMGNDIKISIEQTDLLFIDTWHIYGHLKRELEIHASKVNKYILLHDTTVDAIVGETIRNGWDPVQQSKDSGYPIEEITKGLWPAVEEFLVSHPEWKLEHRYTNNNGLTVLTRV